MANDDIVLLRAITAVFVRRLVRKIAVVPMSIMGLCVVVVAVLATLVHTAWLLAYIVLVPLLVVSVVLIAVTWRVTRTISPRKLTKTEASSILDFSDRLLTVAQAVRAPLPILAYRLVADAVRKRDIRGLQKLLAESKELRDEYTRLKSTLS
jgi:ABC-type multidrug transport system fused ATPase/permease subunit